MWSIGISTSPCEDAARIGYDQRQINRLVIRTAQYFLDRDMRVIFGHDWRADGVMMAIAKFAIMVASSIAGCEEENRREPTRMLNIVPTGQNQLSCAAIKTEQASGGVIHVVSAKDSHDSPHIPSMDSSKWCRKDLQSDDRKTELTAFRHLLTDLLSPGCRICLGGKLDGYEGSMPGIIEEARLAIKLKKPLFLLGGYGGATRLFGETDQVGKSEYWKSDNGLDDHAKRELFNTTDIERALRIISNGIRTLDSRS